MRWVVWDGGERWAMQDEWIEMSGVRWVVWERLPRTTFTHSKAPNPQHQRKIFAPPIDTATPNSVYTQQAAKPACQKDTKKKRPLGRSGKKKCQEDTNVRCSHLLLAQLPRTTFTHSKLPNPHARKTPTQICAPSIGTATPNTVYTQQGAKSACQKDITLMFD